MIIYLIKSKEEEEICQTFCAEKQNNNDDRENENSEFYSNIIIRKAKYLENFETRCFQKQYEYGHQ